MQDKTKLLNVRLPITQLEMLKTIQDQLQSQMDWTQITLSDVFRKVVQIGLNTYHAGEVSQDLLPMSAKTPTNDGNAVPDDQEKEIIAFQKGYITAIAHHRCWSTAKLPLSQKAVEKWLATSILTREDHNTMVAEGILPRNPTEVDCYLAQHFLRYTCKPAHTEDSLG